MADSGGAESPAGDAESDGVCTAAARCCIRGEWALDSAWGPEPPPGSLAQALWGAESSIGKKKAPEVQRQGL